jgi:biopolymer transport protein ExbB
MHFDLIKIFQDMDVFAKAIVSVLLLMGLACLVVFIERAVAFLGAQRRDRAVAQLAAEQLAKGDHHALYQRLDAMQKGSVLAQLLRSGLKTYLGAQKRPGKVPAAELMERELARKTEQISSDLRRGMSVMASTGSVAPFVGLLGTVMGIIASFQGIAKEGSGGLGAVSAGIAEALVVTALGLIIAIPAVLGFNYLSTRIDRIMLALDQSRGELVDYLETNAPELRSEKANAA